MQSVSPTRFFSPRDQMIHFLFFPSRVGDHALHDFFASFLFPFHLLPTRFAVLIHGHIEQSCRSWNQDPDHPTHVGNKIMKQPKQASTEHGQQGKTNVASSCLIPGAGEG